MFLKSDDCMQAIKEKRSRCTLTYEDKKVELVFSPTPHKKGQPFEIKISDATIGSAQAQLIGLSMEMPTTLFDFTGRSLAARISPGICTETKMRWRLKITFKGKNQEVYYTFIDYQVGR